MSATTKQKIESIIEDLESVVGKIDTYDEYTFPLDDFIRPIASHTHNLNIATDAQIARIKETL